MKLYAPDSACKQVDVGRTRYKQDKSGAFTVENKKHEKLLRKIGCFSGTGLAATGAQGYRCTKCGFLAVFKKCGRCGGRCERES